MQACKVVFFNGNQIQNDGRDDEIYSMTDNLDFTPVSVHGMGID